MCVLLVGEPVLEKVCLEDRIMKDRMEVFGSKRQFIRYLGHCFPKDGPKQVDVILAAISPRQKRDLSFGIQVDSITGQGRLGREPLYLGMYEGTKKDYGKVLVVGVANLRKAVKLSNADVIYLPVTVYSWSRN